MLQQEEYLWPTRISFYQADLSDANRALYEYAILESDTGSRPRTASERRVRDILNRYSEGQTVKRFVTDCVKLYLGEHSKYLVEEYCENRALVMGNGSFINTHKDSREGDITCVYFLTGSGEGQPINSVGNPRFVLEDATRYFDEPRLPFEQRHGYSVNPRPGLAVIFPSYVPHNQHPYKGTRPHVQIVLNFRVDLPEHVEEELFD